MAKSKRRTQRAKRSDAHQQWVDELRRSNAAGTHGDTKYKRREKYKTDYFKED